jgi:hypothetical protein
MTEPRRPPKIDNAPGLVWRAAKHGWQARWRARADLAARGFEPKNRRLWLSTAERPAPSEAAILDIADQCNALQTEMLVWGRGGVPTNISFDGTVASLAKCYQTDADSPYRKVRFKTRGFYDRLCSRITEDHGGEELSIIKARNLLRWHEDWSAKGKMSMAHALMGMFRTLVNFGGVFLEDKECERLASALHRMKFAQGKPRTAALTADQVIAIRAEAHRQGFPSIALAQAFQFDILLRQKDVIGEWVPTPEPGVSEICRGNEKWLRGIRWNFIDGELVLRHTTSKRQKDIEVDLKLSRMVTEELGYFAKIPESGPVIICERTGHPWDEAEFRRRWRAIADACGIPSTVRNMDSRAGGITEATDAGANLENVRHAATHGDIKMTQRYSRGEREKTADVMTKRAAFRAMKGGAA